MNPQSIVNELTDAAKGIATVNGAESKVPVDDNEKSELVINTTNMVNESSAKMIKDFFDPNDKFKIDESIASSLFSYIVTDNDDAKYEFMLKCVKHVFSIIKIIIKEKEPDAINPMFGGDRDVDINEVLKNVIMKKTVSSDTIKNHILNKTANLILNSLFSDEINKHIRGKINIIETQIQELKTQITTSYIDEASVQKQLGGTHYLKIEAIEDVRKLYLTKISELNNYDNLKKIIKHSIWSVLKFPAPDYINSMKPIFKTLILLKDEFSNKAIDGMQLYNKIGYIVNFIDNHDNLRNNLVHCVKTQINNGGCIDGFFVRLGVSTPACIETVLKCFTDSTHNANADRTKDVVNLQASSTLYTKPDFTNQVLNGSDLKMEYQGMVSFSKPTDDADVISTHIWDIIKDTQNGGINYIKDIAIDTNDNDVSTMIIEFVDLCFNMYTKIKPLSNSGLFILFNDKEVIDKINSVLMIFSNLVLNTELPTCDNPGALLPDIIDGNPNVVMTPPPIKPSEADSAKLIVFLLTHHLRHMSEPTKNLVSVSINESFLINSLIYEGFEKELDNFITNTELNDQKTMKTFTDIVFKLFIADLGRRLEEKKRATAESASKQYKTQAPVTPSALNPDPVLNPAPTSVTPSLPPPPPPRYLNSTYGGARTRKYRNVKRNKKTRRH